MEAAVEANQWTPIVLLQFGHTTGERNKSRTEISRLEQFGHSLSTVFMERQRRPGSQMFCQLQVV
jgi:hypothetical protein